MELRGRAGIVTGAAKRIGRALALALADEGMDVCVHYHTSEDEAGDVVEEVRDRGVRATPVQADLADARPSAERIVGAAMEAFGRVDVLVNSASIFEPGTLESTNKAHWDRHFAINLEAPFFLCQQFARRLGAGQAGHILNVLDWRATRPPAGHAAYTLTKAGLASLTRLLAQELGPQVQVNGIAPGPILPPPGEGQEVLEREAAKTQLKRSGSPEEIARALRYFLEADFVTGEILHVTGGIQL